MKLTFAIGATCVAGLAVVATQFTTVEAGSRGSVIGPDVTASRIGLDSSNSSDDFAYYGTVNGIRAYSAASTSCNLGDVPAEWIDTPGNARNPVIAQNLYRLSANNTRFEQIGMSWVKHSFCAVSEPTCTPSCSSTSCDTLGVGCADTYWATLNGGSRIGPRWEINPQGVGPGGVHDDIYASPSGNSTIAGRLQVHDSDIIAGARYFVEIQYVTHDEDFNRRWNNASYREVSFSGTTMSGTRPGQSSVFRGDSAIRAWAATNFDVEIDEFEDDPGRGRFELGTLVTDNGDGTWTYEYALRNHNSDRAANMFAVPVPVGVTVSSTGFHDVDYHSGDGWNGAANFEGTDWPAVNAGGAVSWSCADFQTEPNANALRWGTLYNYRLTADTPPVTGNVSIGMYKDGGRESVGIETQVPGPVEGCPSDLAGDDNVTDTNDLFTLLDNWGTAGPGADLAAPNNVVDVFDLFQLLAAWGPCP